MKIIHHIGLNASESQIATFAKTGVKVERVLTSGNVISFDISEDDPRWEIVARLVAQFRATDLVRTEFSTSELDQAKYLRVVPSWYHGYPEPSGDSGYKKATFDLSDYCERCGIGLKQIAPFRMKKAPVWGRRAILQMNWIYDEYFVTPDAWAGVFKPFGIDCRPVLLNTTGAVLDSVVQLEIPTLVDMQDLEEQPYELCECCGRKKIHIVTRGFWPPPAKTDAMMFKSTQYFGGKGGSASKLVIISSELYRKIKEAALKGVTFSACAG